MVELMPIPFSSGRDAIGVWREVDSVTPLVASAKSEHEARFLADRPDLPGSAPYIAHKGQTGWWSGRAWQMNAWFSRIYC